MLSKAFVSFTLLSLQDDKMGRLRVCGLQLWNRDISTTDGCMPLYRRRAC